MPSHSYPTLSKYTTSVTFLISWSPLVAQEDNTALSIAPNVWLNIFVKTLIVTLFCTIMNKTEKKLSTT